MRNVILIAHPDAGVLEHLVDLLTGAGFNCLSASSGSEALATANSYKPQLAVLQADLPEVQGTDVCLRLKQEAGTEQIAVLLIGPENVQERFVGHEVGADAYLTDPPADAALLETVKQLFRALVLNAR